MAKITIEELYRGNEYDVMGAVTVKALKLGIDECTEDGRTWIEMGFVRQNIIAILKLNKNGYCISKKLEVFHINLTVLPKYDTILLNLNGHKRMVYKLKVNTRRIINDYLTHSYLVLCNFNKKQLKLSR